MRMRAPRPPPRRLTTPGARRPPPLPTPRATSVPVAIAIASPNTGTTASKARLATAACVLSLRSLGSLRSNLGLVRNLPARTYSAMASKAGRDPASAPAREEVEVDEAAGSQTPSLPALPGVPEAAGDVGTTTTTNTTPDVGSSAKLDHLGPLVVNVDGTMSRISNWVDMSDIERKNTLRILGKRNQQRLAALRNAVKDDDNQAAGQS